MLSFLSKRHHSRTLLIPENKKLYFITYGDSTFNNALRCIEKEARESAWFHDIKVHSPETIQTFHLAHADFFEKNKRGGGYWIWKPYIILQKLEKMQDGDFLVYLDSGCSINLNGAYRFSQYLAKLEQSSSPIFSFVFGEYIEKHWTKADLFYFFKEKMQPEFMNSGQRMAGVIIFKKSPQALSFAQEWLTLAQVNAYHFIDDSPSEIENDSFFKEHRHDQSIFSVLTKIHGVIAIPQETFPPKRGKKNNWPFLVTRRM